jgi:hypothetical protein
VLTHENVPRLAIAEVELPTGPVQAQPVWGESETVEGVESEDSGADERLDQEGGQSAIIGRSVEALPTVNDLVGCEKPIHLGPARVLEPNSSRRT